MKSYRFKLDSLSSVREYVSGAGGVRTPSSLRRSCADTEKRRIWRISSNLSGGVFKAKEDELTIKKSKQNVVIYLN
jgi:hypothetical protein